MKQLTLDHCFWLNQLLQTSEFTDRDVGVLCDKDDKSVTAMRLALQILRGHVESVKYKNVVEVDSTGIEETFPDIKDREVIVTGEIGRRYKCDLSKLQLIDFSRSGDSFTEICGMGMDERKAYERVCKDWRLADIGVARLFLENCELIPAHIVGYLQEPDNNIVFGPLFERVWGDVTHRWMHYLHLSRIGSRLPVFPNPLVGSPFIHKNSITTGRSRFIGWSLEDAESQKL